MLNNEQKIAVETISWPLLILAWAWVGKTHTLTERVWYMIKNAWVNPNSILCVTFTNKAAREMRERIWKTLWRDVENLNLYRSFDFPLIWTFHSIWVYFLRLFIDKIWYSKDFTILDEDDKLKIVKEILEEKWIDTKDTKPRSVIYSISSAKNLWVNAKMFSFNTKSYFEEKVAEVFEIYERRLREMNLLDFDDILLRTEELLDNEEILAYFNNRFQYFLVDEYQDTNETQYKIIKKLANLNRNLCVVWDDWQWIYSWRWADIKNIINFKKDYPDAVVIKLEQNYRSTQNIIWAANCVIKNNLWIMDKTLWTDNETWGKICLFETYNDKQEVEVISDTIREILDNKNEEVAILYRTNWQSRIIEEALLNKWISYRIYWWLKFYERKEIKDILAYLRIIANPNDIISLKRIINVPGRKIWPKSAETLFSYARNYWLSPLEIMNNAEEITELTPQARKWVAQFHNLYVDFKNYSESNEVENLMKHIIEKLDYESYLMDEYWSDEYEAKMDNLREFRNMATRYSWLDHREALNMFLEDIALITDADIDKEWSSSKVSLMTIHFSKWLEFDNVFIVWLEEWLFPHSRSLTESKELEEERRLMYVAMTRAKKSLYLSRASERFVFGSFSANPPSRFLREIPEDFLEKKQVKTNNFTWFSFNSSSSNFTFSSMNSSFEQPKTRQITHNDVNKFSLWDKVNHIKFGIWTIISLNWNLADIAFGNWNGIKKMNIELAPLEKI